MKGEIRGGMHEGKALMRLAKHYASLMAVLLEVVQNAIDSDAKRISVSVDLVDRTFKVCDNGSGASQEKMGQALQSVCDTLKKSSRRYGMFGIGLISPIAIVRQFTFTTCPEARRNGYVRYTFVSKTIEAQDKVSYPFEQLPLEFDPNGKIWWRTCVEAAGVTKDHRLTQVDVDEMCEEIALRFGDAIRERQITIDVDVVDSKGGRKTKAVVAPEFTGAKLPVEEVEMPECGKLRFELYIARLDKGVRKGKIVFGNFANRSRITCPQFVHCTSSVLESQVGRAIMSGVFEGVILAEKVKMDADRTRFEDNDALVALCALLESWFESDGKKHIKVAEESASDNRFQRIGEEIMPFAELLLKQSDFQSVFEQIRVGTVGTKHHTVPKGRVIGVEDETSVVAKGKGGGEHGGGGSGGEGGGDTPETEHPKHRPFTVYGVRGNKRTEVRGSSTGLRIAHGEFENFRIPYVYEKETGMLTLNMRHPNWGLCTEKDEFLREYHMAVVVSALSLELFNKGEGINPMLSEFAWEALSHQVFAIRNGRALLAKK